MKWFKHMSDASDNPLLREIREEYGVVGIGRWWLIVEAIAKQMDLYSDKDSASYHVKAWSRIIGAKIKTTVEFMRFLADDPTSNMSAIFYDSNQIGSKKLSDKEVDNRVTLSSQNRHKTATLRKCGGFVIEMRLPKLLELRDSKNAVRTHRGAIEVEEEVEKENTKRKKPAKAKKTKPKAPRTALKEHQDIVDMYENTDDLPAKWRDWAIKKGVTINPRIIFEDFCRNHLKRESQWVDWYRTWQTWIAQSPEMNAHYFAKASSLDVRIERIYEHFADQGLFGNDPEFVEVDYRQAVGQAKLIDPNHKPPTINELREKYARA